MKYILPLLTLLIIQHSVIAQQTINGSIMHDGLKRDYIMFIPSTYQSSQPAPLLFSFHGWGSSAVLNRFYTKFDQIANREGFIMIYPQGKLFRGSTHWNVGGFTLGSKIDDVGFTEALIDSISRAYNIDEKRIYATGMSNGGFMSFVLACALSEKIAAIASVTGSMTPQTLSTCDAQHPTPILQIHGDADTTVAYNGNFVSVAIPKVLKYWVNFNAGNEMPVSEMIPDINMNDGSTVEHFIYSNGDNNVNVEHFKVYGGGHTCPGAWGNLDINATKEIWKFLSRYDIDGLIETTAIDPLQIVGSTYQIYPNPVRDQIKIEGDFSIPMGYEIVSIHGNTIMSGMMENTHPVLDVSQLMTGFYILKLGSQSYKFLKME